MSESDPGTKKPSRKDIEKIIEDGEVEKLIHLEETANFEVRTRTYSTDAEDKIAASKAKQTLATDITSIANSGGGYIFIGLETKNKVGQPVEYVSKVVGIKEASVNVESWRAALRDHTVPRITVSSLKYGFIGKEKKVFWMRIFDAKKLGSYPELVRKAKWDVDNKTILKGDMIGLYHRDGAENLLESPEKIQQILAAQIGKESDLQQIELSQFQALSEKLDDLAGSVGQQGIVKQEVDIGSFHKNAKTKLNIDSGYFYIYTAPKKNRNIPNFWDEDYQQKNLYTLIKEPPTLRRMGWGLEVAGSEWPQPNGLSWEIANGKRKLLQVTQAAEVFGAISVDTLLTHGTSDYIGNVEGVSVIINEVALTEYIYNYCVFIQALVKLLGEPTDFDIEYGFVYDPSEHVALLKSDPIAGHMFYKVEGKLINNPRWKDSWKDAVLPQEKAAEIVLNVIKGGFSIPSSPTPIIKNNGKSIIDVEFYRKLG